MTRGLNSLRVSDTRSEIGGAAKTVAFAVPEHLNDDFAWRPGQHVTLRFELNGEDVRRSYSVSSSPFANEPLRITVKRVKGGLVSNHVNDNIKPGDTIEVMQPFGNFCLDPNAKLRRTHYFFAAGSGITPLYSMLRSVLMAEPHSMVHLIYGNRSAKTILFRDTLAALCKAYPDKLTVHHVLSKPSMWSSFSPWRTGSIDKRAVEDAINENPPYAQDTQYYICGPGGMNQVVSSALMGLDVPADRIHSESYGGNTDIDRSIEGVGSTASITLEGQTHEVPIDPAQTVLEAMRSADLHPPFSCQSGVCGACRAQLNEGGIHMRSRTALEGKEIEAGAILTCQTVPTSATISVTFD